MLNYQSFHNRLIAASIMIALSAATTSYAGIQDFHSPCFDITLANNINLIAKTEEKDHGFYRYVFASSNNDDAELQMRVIVSNKKPEKGQSLEDFQLDSLGVTMAIFMDSYKLYQYLKTPENQKILSEKPYQLKLGNKALFYGATLYFGHIDASFLITHPNNMTYAFTLMSKNSNEKIRKNNLKMLTEQLQSIKFQSCGEQ